MGLQFKSTNEGRRKAIAGDYDREVGDNYIRVHGMTIVLEMIATNTLQVEVIDPDGDVYGTLGAATINVGETLEISGVGITFELRYETGD